MIKFEAAALGALFTNTTMLAEMAGRANEKTRVFEMMQRELGTHLETARNLAVCYDLTESVALVERLQGSFSFFASNEEIHIGLKNLNDLMQSEMQKRLFFGVEPKLAEYYVAPSANLFFQPKTVFGNAVDKAFPSAIMDMIEAGNCVAAGRNNGTVYHLMCVAEIGLRTLAWDRKVSTKHNKQTVPLEFAQWGELIEKLEGEVIKIKKWRSKPLGAEAQQFYSAALIEVRAFNTGWRTHVMHARSHTYELDETIALFGHVRRFMQLLAKKISENARTPYVWRNPKGKS